MATWQQFTEDAPQLAETVRARLESAPHHVLGSLRRDGSPRLSGTEVFWHRQYLLLGSMKGSVKARDLRRDARFALHAHPTDASMAGGDAKLSGQAIELTEPAELRSVVEEHPPPGDANYFRLELSEAVLTEVGDDRQHLLIKRWRPVDGVAAFKRYS